jgi:RsiW-degrading membrane proteinase PrsW (M82 family)
VNVALALLPVVLFLIVLRLLDSFRLVGIGAVTTAVVAGMATAIVALVLHAWVIELTAIDHSLFTRYVAPVTEEILKAAFVVARLWQRRVGFLVDAAVLGFAAGTGFALLENVYYLHQLQEAPFTLWLVRGLGTAVLHGATTAIFAMISKALADRREERRGLALLPGLFGAIVIHSAFNHVPLPPLAMTALLLAVLPPIMVMVFERSEAATREWVGAGLDLEIELLDLVRSAHFAGTRFGRYLHELRKRFGGLAAADMFCLLRLELELSIEARAMLIAREAGLEIPVTRDLQASLDELAYLRRSIGPTGLLALKPLQVTSGRDRWHRHLLAAARH